MSVPLQLPTSRSTCWITECVKPKRKPRLHEKHLTRYTSKRCFLTRVRRVKFYRSVPLFLLKLTIEGKLTLDFFLFLMFHFHSVCCRFNWCCFVFDILSTLSLPGHSLGRLWANGPQMLYGSCTDPIEGPGPFKHSDWMVQTLSSFLIGGPYISSTHPTGFPNITR